MSEEGRKKVREREKERQSVSEERERRRGGVEERTYLTFRIPQTSLCKERTTN